MSKESPDYTDIQEAVKALNEAEVPKDGRAGYLVMNDGSIKMFQDKEIEL